MTCLLHKVKSVNLCSVQCYVTFNLRSNSKLKFGLLDSGQMTRDSGSQAEDEEWPFDSDEGLTSDPEVFEKVSHPDVSCGKCR